ncbi:MAG: SDR family oxidoreductase [Spirochaetes bacterium]|nr:SDR family oxidoreductase [Spirochaetota bacterium]
MENFAGKTVFIPGGSSGIGLSVAKLLSREGANVAIFARNRTRLEEAMKEIEQAKKRHGQRFAWYQCDVSDNAQVKKVFTQALRQFDSCDVLINCAGRAYPKYFEDISYKQFEETMKINMFGIWNTCSFLVPHMKQKGGYIVNTSSLAGLVGVFGYSDYSASKFAIVGFSEVLRSELKRYNITVSVLCPPDTDTPGFEVENRTKPDETKEISKSARVMSPDEVAQALLKGMKKKKFIILANFDSKLTWIAKRYAPWLVEAVMDSQIKKVQKKKGTSK